MAGGVDTLQTLRGRVSPHLSISLSVAISPRPVAPELLVRPRRSAFAFRSPAGATAASFFVSARPRLSRRVLGRNVPSADRLAEKWESGAAIRDWAGLLWNGWFDLGSDSESVPVWCYLVRNSLDWFCVV